MQSDMPLMTPAAAIRPDPSSRSDRAATLALIGKYDARVPRYTSYPTAVQFGPGVTETDHRAWLGALPHGRPVSLYVHVPFCRTLCWYCGCHTAAVNRRGPLADYLETLVREVGLVGEALPGRLRAGGLHLGGGTPNLLTPDDLARLIAALGEAFVLGDDLEFAAEIDPRVLTPEWVDAAAALGLDRASLGVQDLDPAVQAAINRHQPYALVEAAAMRLRSAGIGSLNFDLIYGLPRQTVAGLRATIDQVLRLEPDRVALFGYAHVPWMKPHQKLIAEADLPDAVERFAQQGAAAEELERAGYVRIGLDHFARPGDTLATALQAGRVRRNFQGYTSEAPEHVIGFGPSAISSLAQGFAQNAAAVPAWRERIRAGRLATVRGVEIDEEDRFRGDIIARIMCGLAVDLAETCLDHGRPLGALADEIEALDAMAADGLVAWTGEARLAVTGRGRPFVRAVCAVFDRHHRPERTLHARAV